MKISLYILRKMLNEKYPSINFEFCFSSHTNNVHMGLNFSLLPLNDHDQIISDIEKFG